MPIKNKNDVEYVQSEITRLFGDKDVKHYEAIGAHGQTYHLFENHSSVYCACHVSKKNHTVDDFWNAVSMIEAQKSSIAIKYHAKVNTDETIDYLIDHNHIEKSNRELIAKELFHRMREDENYLALVKVPFKFQKKRYDDLVEQGHKRVKQYTDHKSLASDIAIKIAALIRHDWGITPVKYESKNDNSSAPETVEQTSHQLSPNDLKSA